MPLGRIPAVACSLGLTLAFAAGASANSTGGVAAGGAGATAPTAPTTKPVLHLAPVVASRRTSLLYHGPVYQKLSTGEVVPYVAPGEPVEAAGAVSTGGVSSSGGRAVGTSASLKPQLLVPGGTARYVGGIAAAPMNAPPAVQQIIWAGDQIIGLPYIFGGGHRSFVSSGYDCSGTVSFALHGGSLISTPEDSSEFMHWGSHGIGRWVTIFSNSGHAYMTVAGLRLDTSAADDPSNQQGPRWRPLRTGNGGYAVRHPLGL